MTRILAAALIAGALIAPGCGSGSSAGPAAASPDPEVLEQSAATAPAPTTTLSALAQSRDQCAKESAFAVEAAESYLDDLPGRRAEAQRDWLEAATAIAEASGTSDERAAKQRRDQLRAERDHIAGMGEWNDIHALSLRDALWCWGSIAPHACGGEEGMNIRAVSAVGVTTDSEAREAVDNFASFYACYAKAPPAAFVGAEG